MERIKKITVFFIATLLIMSLIPVTFAFGNTYKASFSAQFDKDFNEEYGEWPGEDELKTSVVEFEIGSPATIVIEFDSPVKLGEGFAGIETNAPYPGSTGSLISLKFDDNDFDIGTGELYVNDEGIDKRESLRLTLYNIWESKIENQPLDLTGVGEFSKIELTFIVEATDDLPEGLEEEISLVFDPDSRDYMAYLGVQMNNWVFRNAWACEHYGANGGSWGDENYFNGLYHTDDKVLKDGDFVDVPLTGNGTYKVSLNNYNFVTETGGAAGPAEFFNQLFVSTNVPLEGNPLTITDVKVYIGGQFRYEFEEGYIAGIDTKDSKDYYEIFAINQWNNDLKELFNDMVPASGEIAIEFTVAGFNYDNEDDTDDVSSSDETAEAAAGDDDGFALDYMPEPPAPIVEDDDGGISVWVYVGGGAAVLALLIIVVIVLKKKK